MNIDCQISIYNSKMLFKRLISFKHLLYWLFIRYIGGGGGLIKVRIHELWLSLLITTLIITELNSLTH
jgi:hypothetical protein